MREISSEKFSILEYLEMEEQAIEKHEYHNGLIVDKPSGSINHSLIGSRVNALIVNALDEKESD